MKTLDKIWSIRVANFYRHEMDVDPDIVLELKFESLDKNTCMVINGEIACINIFEMVNGKVILAETLEGDMEGSQELYDLIIYDYKSISNNF